MDQTTQNGIIPKQGWSWGAFSLNFYFLIAVKKYRLLWWYLLAVIPFLNIVFFFVFAIYLGVKGHELGTSGGQFASQAEYDGYMKGTDHSGKIVFIVSLIIFVLVAIFFLAAASLGLFSLHTPMAAQTYPAGISTY